MNSRNLVFFVTVFFGSVNAMASTWKGTGFYEAWGVGAFEAQVEITAAREGDRIFSKDCWSFLRNGQPWRLCSNYELDIREETQVWYYDKQVGSYLNHRLDVFYKTDEGQIEALVRVNPDGSLDYSQSAKDRLDRYTRKKAVRLVRQ